MPLTPLTENQIDKLIRESLQQWQLSDNGKFITRKFKTKGFNQALSIANLCGAVADTKNHHPDIQFGWGYCDVSFTTHSVSALTTLDIECAEKLDALCECLYK